MACLYMPTPSTHGYGDIDAKVTMVSEQLGNVCVKHKTITGNNGRLDSIVNTPRSGLPRQTPTMAIQLESEM